MACDKGRLRVVNEDAGYADMARRLFVVSDGMGGLPAGGAASHVIVRAMPTAVTHAMRFIDDEADDATVHAALAGATIALSRAMFEASQRCHGIHGWGATVVAMLVRGRKAHILHVGDSRAYLVRGRKLVPLTDDHSYVSKLLAHGRLVTEEYEQKNRYLVSQHVAMRDNVSPSVRTVKLMPGDRLLLCTDGLSGPLSDRDIGRLLLSQSEPLAACQTLVEAANAAGGPDNITALVVDFQGVREASAVSSALDTGAIDPADRSGERVLPVELERLHEAFGRLEAELQWLAQGAMETAGPEKVAAMAAAKRMLGEARYVTFIQRYPNDSPVHTFHRGCADVDSEWLERYDTAVKRLEPLIAQLAASDSRLCPLLSNEAAARIIVTLWNELRGIEKRYLAICRRGELDKRERTLDILIEHMLESTRTLVGLVQFLPLFDLADLPHDE